MIVRYSTNFPRNSWPSPKRHLGFVGEFPGVVWEVHGVLAAIIRVTHKANWFHGDSMGTNRVMEGRLERGMGSVLETKS